MVGHQNYDKCCYPLSVYSLTLVKLESVFSTVKDKLFAYYHFQKNTKLTPHYRSPSTKVTHRFKGSAKRCMNSTVTENNIAFSVRHTKFYNLCFELFQISMLFCRCNDCSESFQSIRSTNRFLVLIKRRLEE